MKILALAFTAALAIGSAQADPLPVPAMSGPIASDAAPPSFDAGFGTLYWGASITGLGYFQTNPTHGLPGNGSSGIDLSNGQAWLEKTNGVIQFYVQAGIYSLPSLGAPYIRSSQITAHTFGSVPVGYIKIAPDGSSWSIEAGKLPTLIGAEFTFTFENMNIERGLLWNQEPAISRGVQVNYASGPLSFSLSWNDGYYSNSFSTVSGLVSYAFDSANTLALSGGGSLAHPAASTFVTSPVLNNSQIYDLIYTYNAAPWLVTPYVQYQHVDSHAATPVFIKAMDDWGFGLLVNYAVSPTFNIAARAEYETSSGGFPAFGQFPLPYGPGSKAWSLTVTPTWQFKDFFIRAEGSYTRLSDSVPGILEFGKSFDKDSQARLMIETGVQL
ncbi:MAG: outer membrane beta-barrel protein [Rhizomicrobium sp.]